MKILNVSLASAFCMLIAFLPYIFIAEGTGLNWVLSLVQAIKDAFDVVGSSSGRVFLTAITGGVISLISVILLFLKKVKLAGVDIILANTTGLVLLNVYSAWLIRDIPVISIAIIPLLFAMLAARKENNSASDNKHNLSE